MQVMPGQKIKKVAGVGTMENSLLEEIKLRRFVRKVIRLREKKILEEQSKVVLEEQNLRKVIRHLLLEAEVDTDTEPVPYKKTSINYVNTVFGTVLKPIKKGLRMLTDGPEERLSYRDHIYQSFFDLFRTLNTVAGAGETSGEEPLTEQDIEIEIGDADEGGPEIVPDEEKVKPSKEEEEEGEFKKFSITGKDETGARQAYEVLSSSNIEDTIQKFHRMLGDDQKRKEFEGYFMYNLDLFVIKFENKLAREIAQEPAFTEPVIAKPPGAIVREPAGSEEEEGGPPPDTMAPAPADEELPPL
jgi:hypothetical protein